MKFGYRLEQGMLISCTYNGETCTYRDFIPYWDNQFAMCFKFNSDITRFKHRLAFPEEKSISDSDEFLDKDGKWKLKLWSVYDFNTSFKNLVTSKSGSSYGLQMELLVSTHFNYFSLNFHFTKIN
jgi:hypothetical protein